MKRHRILHLRASNFVGGPEHQLLRYAELERAGKSWDISLGTFVGPGEGSDFFNAIQARGLQAVSLPAGSWVSALKSLMETIRRERIELLCTHGYRSDVLGLIASRLLHIPIACFLRGWIGENKKVRLYEGIDRFAIQFANRIVCLSPSQAKRIASRSQCANKIRIVCNAINAAAVKPSLKTQARRELCERFKLPENCLLVATAGRLSPEKGASDFLEAVTRTNDLPSDIRFLVFGEGVLRKNLEQRAASLNLQDRIIFAGFHSDVRSLLPGLDLLVNPSLSEEMPNIVLEGMAARVAVVATRVGGVADIAGANEAIRLVPPGNPEVLAEAITHLLQNRRLRQSLAEAGFQRVQQAFSLSAQQSQLHDLYQELLPSPRLESETAADPVAVARLSAAPRQLPPTEAEFLSVVVPVRNEEAHIGDVLAGLAAQDYPHERFEVIVADGNSTDRTATVVQEIAKSAPMSIRLLSNPSQLSSAGRNIGARNARGKLVIYIDGHCQIPSKTLLRDAVDLFERTGADCLCRPQPLTMPGNTPFQDVVAHARASALGHARDSTIYSSDWEGPVNPASSGAMYRREVFERVGFFDECFDACEDVEFNYRVHKAGLRSFYSTKLQVVYEPRRNLVSLWKQMMRYGQGRCRLIQRHPDAFSISQIIPAMFLLWLIAGGALSLRSWQIADVFLASVFLYLATVLVFSCQLGVKYGWRHFVTAPAVFVCIHLGLGAGFLKEFLTARGAIRRRTKPKHSPVVSVAARDASCPE